MKRQLGVAKFLALAVIELQTAHSVESIDKLRHVNNLAHGVMVALLRFEGAAAQSLLANGLDTLPEPVDVAHHQHHVATHEVEQRHAIVNRLIGGVVDDAHAREPLLGELRLDIKSANAVNLIAKEIDAVRVFVAEGINVEDGAAHRELPRFVDIIHLLEVQLTQLYGHLRQIHLAADVESDCRLLNLILRHNFLGQCLGTSNHPPQVGIVVPAVEDLGAQDFLRGIDLAILDVALVARREHKHIVLARELAQVVVEIARLVEVVGHNEIRLVA